MIPLGVARPCSLVAASTSPQVQPPPTRTVRAVGIDLDLLHGREVDDDSAVAGAEPGSVVPAAANRQQEVAIDGEAHHGGDVVRVGALGDQRGTLVDHRVVDLARLLVVRVLGADQPPLELRQLRTGGVGGVERGQGLLLRVRVLTSLCRIRPFVTRRTCIARRLCDHVHSTPRPATTYPLQRRDGKGATQCPPSD